MNCVNTVTISLDEYNNLRAKERAIDAIESNPEAFLLYEVSDHRYFAWKRFMGHSTSIIEGLQITNKGLQDQVFALKNQQKHWYEQYKNLEEKVNSRRWFEFWK
jgi:hypothetical protein